MTNKEFHINIDQELQDTGLTVNEDYLREEIDLAINAEIMNFIKMQLPHDVQNGKLVDKYSEDSERLANLIASEELNIINGATHFLLPDGTTTLNSNGTLISRCIIPLSVKFKGEYCGNSHDAPLRISSNTNYQRSNNPYSKSKVYSMRGRRINTRIEFERIGDFVINKIQLDYIRMFRKLVYSDSEYEYTDIPNLFQGEIVNGVVRRMRKRGTNDYQIQVAEQNLTK